LDVLPLGVFHIHDFKLDVSHIQQRVKKSSLIVGEFLQTLRFELSSKRNMLPPLINAKSPWMLEGNQGEVKWVS
jgi:hypothetical protein